MPKHNRVKKTTTKKKTTRLNKFAISSAALTDTNDLLLTGTVNLQSYQGENPLPATSAGTIEKKIGTKQNFYYYIIQRNNVGSIIRSEKGVGEVRLQGGHYFLVREFPTRYSDGTAESPARPLTFIDFVAGEPRLTVQSYIPPNYFEALLSPFSVLCSIEQFTPSPVELEENTLLGRKDDLIQSIDKDELREILTDKNIIGAICDTANILNFKSKGANFSKQDSLISAHVIQVKPVYDDNTRPPKPRRGSIIFNDNTKCFEGFDGTTWRKLGWGN